MLFADSDHKDVPGGFMLAMSWMRLNRLDDAWGLLEQLEG